MYRLLIIEDDQGIAEAIKNRLKHGNYKFVLSAIFAIL